MSSTNPGDGDLDGGWEDIADRMPRADVFIIDCEVLSLKTVAYLALAKLVEASEVAKEPEAIRSVLSVIQRMGWEWPADDRAELEADIKCTAQLLGVWW